MNITNLHKQKATFGIVALILWATLRQQMMATIATFGQQRQHRDIAKATPHHNTLGECVVVVLLCLSADRPHRGKKLFDGSLSYRVGLSIHC